MKKIHRAIKCVRQDGSFLFDARECIPRMMSNNYTPDPREKRTENDDEVTCLRCLSKLRPKKKGAKG